jgi:dUTP pyrophosphatase
MPVRIPLRLLDTGVAPAYAKPGDAGADLSACEDLTLAPGERALVRTGVALAIPDGCAGMVHPRSGLAARHGISIVNAPGTIDSGYRGEILVNLVNLGTEPFRVCAGDRIAQLLIVPVIRAEFVTVDSLPESERGETGHGSSGGFAARVPDPTEDDAPDRRETD